MKKCINRFVQINSDDQRRYDGMCVMFENVGTVDVFINNVMKLIPGKVWASNLPADCIDCTEYIFRFATAPGTRQVLVTYTLITN